MDRKKAGNRECQQRRRNLQREAFLGLHGEEKQQEETLRREHANKLRRQRRKPPPLESIAARVGRRCRVRRCEAHEQFQWLHDVRPFGKKMSTTVAANVRWRFINCDSKWHQGTHLSRPGVAFEFRNVFGEWCARFEKRTSTLGQSLGLYAACTFKEGELVTVFAGKWFRKSVPFRYKESRYYAAEIRMSGGGVGHVDPCGGAELMGAHYINCSDEDHPANLDFEPSGQLRANRHIYCGEEFFFDYNNGQSFDNCVVRCPNKGKAGNNVK